MQIYEYMKIINTFDHDCKFMNIKKRKFMNIENTTITLLWIYKEYKFMNKWTQWKQIYEQRHIIVKNVEQICMSIDDFMKHDM